MSSPIVFLPRPPSRDIKRVFEYTRDNSELPKKLLLELAY